MFKNFVGDFVGDEDRRHQGSASGPGRDNQLSYAGLSGDGAVGEARLHNPSYAEQTLVT